MKKTLILFSALLCLLLPSGWASAVEQATNQAGNVRLITNLRTYDQPEGAVRWVMVGIENSSDTPRVTQLLGVDQVDREGNVLPTTLLTSGIWPPVLLPGQWQYCFYIYYVPDVAAQRLGQYDLQVDVNETQETVTLLPVDSIALVRPQSDPENGLAVQVKFHNNTDVAQRDLQAVLALVDEVDGLICVQPTSLGDAILQPDQSLAFELLVENFSIPGDLEQIKAGLSQSNVVIYVEPQQ